jgi:tRNA A37 threonylcarbamoyladenosine synthetase subunit TsaC/SUA5/YrdC
VATTFPEASGLDGIIDGGRRDGAVSTVLELNDRWTLRREGAIPLEDLAAILDIPS